MRSKLFKGYYRYPTINGNKIIFVAEDDLWVVDSSGGTARRLTTNAGNAFYPYLSPDGKNVAFVSTEEGNPEVYVMDSEGGPAKRLTFLGSSVIVVNWKNNENVIFASNFAQPFRSIFYLYSVNINTGNIEKLPYGPARNVSFGKGVVIGRNTGDPARWKRYRGGTAGEIWIDKDNTGDFSKLLNLKGNLANPMWIGDRIYFLSDHEGIGNLYSCLPDGTDIKKHTKHKDFYARNATTDGVSIVYHAGADIFLYNVKTEEQKKVPIEYRSPFHQRKFKFVQAAKYLEDYNISSDGSHLAIVARGKSFVMGNWEGPVLQQGKKHGVRYRLTRWLKDKKRVVLISDETGEDRVEIHSIDDPADVKKFEEVDVGRPYEIKVSPVKDEVAISNHRHELLWLNLTSGEKKIIEKSEYGPIRGFNWSPDGRWIAYSFPVNRQNIVIKIANVENGEIHQITEPVGYDFNPIFDPDGKFLYFISARIFNPVYDRLYFDLNFPKSMKPYLVVLKKDVESPFIEKPRGFGQKPSDKEDKKNEKKEEKKIEIDFDDIQKRIVEFPVKESIYGEIYATPNKVFYTEYPVEGSLRDTWLSREQPARATIKVYDLKENKEDVFVSGVTNFKISEDYSTIVYRAGNKLRVISSEKKPEDEKSSQDFSRKTGWINLERIKLAIVPVEEWKQMLKEAWRLQRDYFWREDMGGKDWRKVLELYYPLVERVASRNEFSDLVWEMQGELGTSHAYEFGGDYRIHPNYPIGFLGADFEYDEQHNAYRVKRILNSDPWDEKESPPLLRPGLNIKEGMLLYAIDGERLDKENPPYKVLLNKGGTEVQLTIGDPDGNNKRNVWVKTSMNESRMRYRDWVERNREYVHNKTDGRVGYIHIPDMGAWGYSQFHRYFLLEFDKDALIIDVRFNGGGHVSQLLLEKLARKRVAYTKTRWMGVEPYPDFSPKGPMIAIINEYAGSDGDIFSHVFKMMKLGKLIGRRTWGGVIGMWPRNWLVDGTITTQPEFAFWFKDVGWKVENYGVDPDVEIDITPAEYMKGVDPQLDFAIDEMMKELAKNPPDIPEL